MPIKAVGASALLLQQQIEALVARLMKGRLPDFLQQHARLIDDYFRNAFAGSRVGPALGIDKNPYAIIALGGYGRQEQCLRSDVDLLLLFEKKVPVRAEDLVREVIYPLWDLGMDVGYATRSMKECLLRAGRDFDVLAPMLDARFICGMSPLYTRLMEQLRNDVIASRSRHIIEWLVQRNARRHEAFGDSAARLEPNIKEGLGGLRDYHTMLWIARIELNLQHIRDLLYLGRLSDGEYRELFRALQFIWHVRNHLHYLSGRKLDQLRFENQLELAKILNYRKKGGQQPVERFMAELHGCMEFLRQQLVIFLYELGLEKTRRRRRLPRKETSVDGLEVVRGGMLQFASPEKIVKSPALLMDIFVESARLKIPLGAEARRLVKEFSYLVDKKFQTSPALREAFEKILVVPDPQFDVLKEMLNTGFLVRYIPPFGDIADRIQYDEYHLYPVDRHCLRTVATLKKFGSAQKGHPLRLYEKICRELKNKKLLLWAALLHDIGKGGAIENHAVKGAVVARRVLIDKAMDPGQADTIAFLVREHLLLIKTATRRDIQDEETAIACARRVRDVQRLKMLYLLTVADSMSTGPMAWNDWVATLLRDFFLRVLNVLEKGELATPEAVEIIERKKEKLAAAASSAQSRQQLQALIDVMAPRYLLYTSAEEISDHLKLVKRLGKSPFVWDIKRLPNTGARTVTICTRDRPGLVAKIAGVFTLNNIDILDVQVFTWRNQIALDIFKVKPPPDLLLENEKWDHAKQQLQAALSEKLDPAVALARKLATGRQAKRRLPQKPHRVTVDNRSSSFFTIVDVVTYDFPGLLCRITDALFQCNLNIWLAKIATKADQVVDVFYVRDLNGQKADSPEQVAAIQAAIHQRLPAIE
jgi:[protein-PII] uridylyltransferase